VSHKKTAEQCFANHYCKAAYKSYSAQAQLNDAGFNTFSLVCCNKTVGVDKHITYFKNYRDGNLSTQPEANSIMLSQSTSM